MTRKENKSELIVVGLDIGITSVGWAVIDAANDKLKDFGVRHFEDPDKPSRSKRSLKSGRTSKARRFRSARRNLRHKKWRKAQLKKAFVDFGVVSEQEMSKDGFAMYNATGNGLQRPKDYTVYHLRQRARKEKVTPRELFLCLYNIAQARGHFLMQNINFENTEDDISFKTYKERFYELSEAYIEYYKDRSEFEDEILSKIFECELDRQTIEKTIKTIKICQEKDENKLINFVKFIRGYKARLDVIDESLALLDNDDKPKRKPVSIDDDLKKEEIIEDVHQKLIDLADMAKIHKIINNNEYICDIHVRKIDEYNLCRKRLAEGDLDNIEESIKQLYRLLYNKEGEDGDVNELTEELKGNKKCHRLVKNVQNTYPNGLYLKEAKAILQKQKEFYGDIISDDFIDVCISNLSSRIPYYIGPLSKDAKNAWLVRDDNKKFIYSYSHSQDEQKNGKIVDESASIEKWKKRMVSHCTYFPEEVGMPKGSFIYETFSIINEINSYTATDKNGNDYYELTYEDKCKVFNELFLKKKKVKFSDVVELLDHLEEFGPRYNTEMKEFNNAYTIYFDIIEILKKLKIDDIKEIFSESKKIDRLEEIILDLNIFDEKESKFNFFMSEDCDYVSDENVAKNLSKLNTKGSYSLSKKFIMDYKINWGKDESEDIGPDSLLYYLFNTSRVQSYLIAGARDESGREINLSANKYEAILKNDPRLSIKLLINDDKSVIPISRPVIRALNEALKVYSQIIEWYGEPDRLVIEMARELTDKKKTNKKTEPRYTRIKKLHESLIEQKEYCDMIESDWEKVESFLDKNILKIELYLRQGGCDMITGEKINLDNLDNYEIDHILPIGFGDDSMDNKELIRRDENRLKNDKLPLESIGNKESAKKFIDRVNKLHETKIGDEPLISDKKRKLLLMENADDVEGFINRNIVDTRYIAKEFMSIIKAYNKVNNYETHVSSLKAAYTKIFSKGLDIIKDRDTGLQHHAIDATIVAIADTCLEKMFPNYDKRDNEYYKRFTEVIASATPNRSGDGYESGYKLKRMIKNAYFSAFGKSVSHSKLLSDMKSETPLISEKPLKNYRGAYFKATMVAKKDRKDPKKDPLSILEINNKERAFSGVECAAVDFYKLPKVEVGMKEKREHVAIHIPKVIIDNDGNIDKEKYIKLIDQHYNKHELLDGEGGINEKFFRFRAFKNDIIYDTTTKEPQRFVGGSIVNKKLEYEAIEIFSYNEIMDFANEIEEKLTKRFNIQSFRNKSGTKSFRDIDRNDMINYIVDDILDNQERNKYVNAIQSDIILPKRTYVDTFARRVAAIVAGVDKSPSSGKKRNILAADKNEIKKDPDAEYVKLKYSVLGIRFSKHDNGALIITGPKGITKEKRELEENEFKKIKREKFYWQFKKDVV